MNNITDFVVPWVKSAEPYSDKHMDIAWANPEIIRMMSNENLLTPSENVLQAIVEAARLGNLYPGSGPELRKKLGEAAGLTGEHVVLGNGSTDVINFVVHTFVSPGAEVIIPVPTFPMYEARVKVAGGTVVQVPMKPDFTWDIETILKAVTPRTKLIFTCSPNNPTGNQFPLEDLKQILALGIPTFFDEAYYELENEVEDACPHDPGVPAHDGQPDLLEGLRVGRTTHRLRTMRPGTGQLLQPGTLPLECQPDRDTRLPWPRWMIKPTRSVNARMSSLGARPSPLKSTRSPVSRRFRLKEISF